MSASNSSCAVFARVHTASSNRYTHICAKTVQKHPTHETIPVSIAILLYPGVDGRELLKISDKIIKNHMDVHFVSYTGNPVPTNTGMLIVPTNTPDTPMRKPDLLLVPGSLLQDAENVLQDQSLLLFLKKLAERSSLICGVSTGCLILAAADLLTGYHAVPCKGANTIFAAMDVISSDENIVVDRNRITMTDIKKCTAFLSTMPLYLQKFAEI